MAIHSHKAGRLADFPGAPEDTGREAHSMPLGSLALGSQCRRRSKPGSTPGYPAAPTEQPERRGGRPGVTAGETAHILPTGRSAIEALTPCQRALGGRRVGSSRGGSIPPEGTGPLNGHAQSWAGEVGGPTSRPVPADYRRLMSRFMRCDVSTRGPGSPRCALTREA